MKFDNIDWKIFAFKVGKQGFFNNGLKVSNDFDRHLWNSLKLNFSNFKFCMLRNPVESLGKKFPKKTFNFHSLKNC